MDGRTLLFAGADAVRRQLDSHEIGLVLTSLVRKLYFTAFAARDTIQIILSE